MRLIDKYIVFLFHIVWTLLIVVIAGSTVLGPLMVAIYGFVTNDKVIAASGVVLCFFIPVGLKFTDMMIDVLRK